MAQKSFKTDESFLEKLAIGAVGTKKVIEDLYSQGHMPIELERGSTGFKIWKTIKIKRLRVPDILCVNSGTRIESRAKTKLVISMSHSQSNFERGWDYGLKDEDYSAFVVCEKSGNRPIDWKADPLVQYVKISDLRTAFKDNQVMQERPKGSEEGFETRLTWPSTIASNSGEIIDLDSDKIRYKRDQDNRIISLSLNRKGIQLRPILKVGERFVKNKILASVIDVFEKITSIKSVDSDFYLDLLNSLSIPDRYTAAKAFSFIQNDLSNDSLIFRINDNNEHIYVRLEAAATLARKGISIGFDFIEDVLSSHYYEQRLEAVIILGEIASNRSCNILRKVLVDISQPEEIRGGAAWSLGELNLLDAIPDLISTFETLSPVIKMEAARALRKLSDNFSPIVIDEFFNTSEVRRPGVAWALAKTEVMDVIDFLSRHNLYDIDKRHWMAFILGHKHSNDVITEIEKIRNDDPELYFAVTLLWKIYSSWIYDLKEY
jgi:hypothetical protein